MVKKLLLLVMMLVALSSCQNREEMVEYVYLIVGESVGFNPFGVGDVRLCVDDHHQFHNVGTSEVEIAFVKDLVYKIQLIKKIPKTGWSDVVDAGLQYGYVARMKNDDGTYRYCRFYVFNIDYTMESEQYYGIKYQSDFEPN